MFSLKSCFANVGLGCWTTHPLLPPWGRAGCGRLSAPAWNSWGLIQPCLARVLLPAAAAFPGHSFLSSICPPIRKWKRLLCQVCWTTLGSSPARLTPVFLDTERRKRQTDALLLFISPLKECSFPGNPGWASLTPYPQGTPGSLHLSHSCCPLYATSAQP